MMYSDFTEINKATLRGFFFFSSFLDEVLLWDQFFNQEVGYEYEEISNLNFVANSSILFTKKYIIVFCFF